jgi:hypothetical protein
MIGRLTRVFIHSRPDPINNRRPGFKVFPFMVSTHPLFHSNHRVNVKIHSTESSPDCYGQLRKAHDSSGQHGDYDLDENCLPG